MVYPGDEVDDHSTVAAVNPEHTEGWESEPIEDLFGWAVNLEEELDFRVPSPGLLHHGGLQRRPSSFWRRLSS